MRKAKSVLLAMVPLVLGLSAAGAQGLDQVDVKDARGIEVPPPDAPIRFLALPENFLTAEPEPGSFDAGSDPDPYVLKKPDESERSAAKGVSYPGVPQDMLDRAMAYYTANQDVIKNRGYLGIVDFGRFSGEARFFSIDMNAGTVKTYRVAHGSGSDPDDNGRLDYFSNESGSHKTSRGFYKVSELGWGDKVGRYAALDGLTPAHNSRARARGILIHGADYVSATGSAKIGMSWGCLAVAWAYIEEVMNNYTGGALIYADTSGNLYRD